IAKALASSRVAGAVGVDGFWTLADVDSVYRDLAAPQAQPLPRLTAADARALLASDELGQGNMAPKVRAAAEFAEAGGEAAIGALEAAELIVAGRAGTRVVPTA